MVDVRYKIFFLFTSSSGFKKMDSSSLGIMTSIWLLSIGSSKHIYKRKGKRDTRHQFQICHRHWFNRNIYNTVSASSSSNYSKSNLKILRYGLKKNESTTKHFKRTKQRLDLRCTDHSLPKTWKADQTGIQPSG